VFRLFSYPAYWFTLAVAFTAAALLFVFTETAAQAAIFFALAVVFGGRGLLAIHRKRLRERDERATR